MKKIVIVGAGGLAREVKWLIDDINRINNQYEFLGYIVSNKENLKETDSKDLIIGDFSWFDSLKNESIHVAIGIGNPKHRIDISNILCQNDKVIFPSLIHPSVIYDEGTCSIGKGVILCANNILTVNIKINDFALINLACAIGHESEIGEGVVINSKAKISGGVSIGKGSLIGTSASILQYRSVGSFSTLGASSCLTRSIPNEVTAFGVPAKIIKTKL